VAKRLCQPEHRSGHDFRIVTYIGNLPYTVVCRRCGRAIGLTPSDQFTLRATDADTLANLPAMESN
jgi:hypothetical protein